MKSTELHVLLRGRSMYLNIFAITSFLRPSIENVNLLTFLLLKSSTIYSTFVPIILDTIL